MPGPLSQPHGHTASGTRVVGKSKMKAARVTSCKGGCSRPKKKGD